MTSPGTMKRGGSIAAPMPSGVPVMMTVPGSSVISLDAQTMSSTQLKIWSAVLEFCIVVPFRRDEIPSLSAHHHTNPDTPASAINAGTAGGEGQECAPGSGMTSGVTRTGPIGQKVSKDLPLTHWLQKRCQCREETSLETE